MGELQENPNESLKDQLKETFDFQQHQLKETSNKEEEKKLETEEEKPKYEASNFFDQISNSSQKREDRIDARTDNRRKDAETFGFSTSQNFHYENSRSRGGRGNRGGYRGGSHQRGRGKY